MMKSHTLKNQNLIVDYNLVDPLQPVRIGAVYYRRSNPPERDWERDYSVAAEDGIRIFRHWFLWGAINYAPGKYNWEPYDRKLDLAEKYNIKTVIAEFIINVPEWLYHEYPYARKEHYSGRKAESEIHISCATGGHNAMCLDNKEVEEAAKEFLTELAKRYRNHPALYGYDIWNECSWYSPENLCYCPATQNAFREWLKKKYNNDLDALNKAWRRFSYTSWDQVQLPRKVVPYPENFDAVEFFNDNSFKWMKWRADILREHDPNHYIIAHGNAKSFSDIAPACGDDWEAAKVPDIFGYTYWYANRCHPLLAGDMIRSASNGKEFWRAEAIGNSDWEKRSVRDNYHPEKDAMADPENIRLDAMISFMAGARTYMNPRWRSLQDGPLFGAYGWYGLDGSRTDRSGMVSEISKWAYDEKQKELWTAMPVRGEVGILLLEEAQANCYLFNGNTDYYSLSIQGCYEAFKESNIQADLIKIDQIMDYSLVYVPYPVGLSDETMKKLQDWIAAGGFLVGEACFGYFDGHGHALEKQPNRGFDEVFGCREDGVSFAPDRWKELKVHTLKGTVNGAILRQSYTVETGEIWGTYDDGRVAVVKNKYGKGCAMIIGTIMGFAYKEKHDEPTRKFFASLLEAAGKRPLVSVPNNSNIVARICADREKAVLWVVNESRVPQRVRVYLDKEAIKFSNADAYRGKVYKVLPNVAVEVEVPGRDAAVLKLY